MCVAQTCKRRRRQAANGYKHIDPKRRPLYKHRDVTAQIKRLARLVEKEKMMQQRKGKKK